MVVSRKKKSTAPRKPFHAGGKGYENSIISKSNNNGGHVSNPVAEAEHKEGKRDCLRVSYPHRKSLGPDCLV